MHEDFGDLQHRETDFTLESYPPLNHYADGLAPLEDHALGMLHEQYSSANDYVGTFPVPAVWHPHPMEYGPLFDCGLCPAEIPQTGLQLDNSPYAEKAIQTELQDAVVDNQAHRQPPLRHHVSQVTYKATKQGTVDPRVIDFIVNDEIGVRLSDASDGDWTGFKGRDDRSLFEGNRTQIMFRLHPDGCPPWQSKIPIADFTGKRRPITRMKLAAEVAKSVDRFLMREKLEGHGDDHSQCPWGSVSLESIFLTRVIRVSVGSWQPELYVERPSAASQQAASSSSY